MCSNSFILYWKKTSQEILYMAMLDYLLWYVRSKSGQKLVVDATVVYSCDLNLRTSYFSIVSFRLGAWETRHSRHCNLISDWESSSTIENKTLVYTLRTQSPDFSIIFNFHYLTICLFKFAFQNGVNELFRPSGSGDIPKQLLKNQFWKLKNQRFCPHFLKFDRGEIFLKICLVFWILNVHISRTVNARELNEAILKFSH